MKTIVCSKCGKEKPLSKFTKDRTNKSGLSSRCKACSVILSQDYRKRHIEKIKQYDNFRYINNKILMPCIDIGKQVGNVVMIKMQLITNIMAQRKFDFY